MALRRSPVVEDDARIRNLSSDADIVWCELFRATAFGVAGVSHASLVLEPARRPTARSRKRGAAAISELHLVGLIVPIEGAELFVAASRRSTR